MEYSDIELALLAEPVPQLDIHRVTASEMFNVPYSEVTPEQRKAAKTLNFRLVYGVYSGIR
ncbi:DNA polymerase [Pectobacterium phage PPWS2]|uniref:DNA polymerase n=1 Tax=Pectobacterium phage PPWS2 TaxID=2153295 RepID=A0A3G9EM57_9CAUD|nr:DNA polymerase [Pectobacterium phage PPWS2]BBD74637.1 DNA polymerase [Pectobacterium phage PPWS2]